MSAASLSAGTLVLVVGPSGAGKDSIIAGAASRLRNDEDFVFARRSITRPVAAGGESHVALSAAEFASRRERGLFLLHWHAHGLDYGVPAAIAADRAVGRTVVANVSRVMVGEARARLLPLRIVQILASQETLAARLALRGRESASDIRRRLERAGAEVLSAADVTTMLNDGTLEHAVDQFVTLLRSIAAQQAAPVVAPESR